MAKSETKKTKSVKSDKPTKVRKVYTEYDIWTYNNDSQLELIKLPFKYKNEFIARFGVTELANTNDVLTWISNMNLRVESSNVYFN